MKNILNYYYNLIINEFHQKKRSYFFEIGKYQYIFLPFYRSVKELQSLYFLNTELLKLNVPYHKIILNKDYKILTLFNGMPYVLLQIILPVNRLISYDDLLQNQFTLPIRIKKEHSIIRFNWVNLWQQKIDYFEYQIEHFQNKFPILLKTLPYFIGLGENAISYVQNTFMEENGNFKSDLTICHRRVKADETLIEYYNPLDLIIDHKTRDIAEYIKSCFLQDKYNINEIAIFIGKLKLTKFEYRLLYGRLLFPSFYFDMYDNIINDSSDEKQILEITSRIDEYEHFLYDIYLIIKQYADIPVLTWLNKKFFVAK